MTERLSYNEIYSSNQKTQNLNSNDSYDEVTKTKIGMDFQDNYVDPRQIGVIFKRKTRYFIFIILVVTNLIINMDHGTIPAATSEIKLDLSIGDDTLGIFGSLVYFGNLLGIFSFMFRFNGFF